MLFRSQYKSGFRTKKEAERAEFIYLNSKEEKGGTTITLYEIAEEVDRTKQRTLKFDSARNSSTDFRLHIKPYFKNKQMSNITKKECKDFAEKIAGLDLSSKSKNDILHLFKSFFTYAQDIYDLTQNSSTIIKPIKKTYDEEQVGEVWTVEEFENFISYFDITDPIEHRWGLLFTLAFWSGARRGELLALTFNDIDLVNKTISITKSVLQNTNGKDFVIDSPKTKSSIRKVTLDDKTITNIALNLNSFIYSGKFYPGGFAGISL